MSIVYLSQMSAACRAGLTELCTDASCESYLHDGDDLEPFESDCDHERAERHHLECPDCGAELAPPEPLVDDMTWLSADDRARRREATR